MDRQDAPVSLSTDLIPSDQKSHDIAQLSRIADQSREFVEHSKAANTLRAYKTDWQDFTRWCEAHRLDSLPAMVESQPSKLLVAGSIPVSRSIR